MSSPSNGPDRSLRAYLTDNALTRRIGRRGEGNAKTDLDSDTKSHFDKLEEQARQERGRAADEAWRNYTQEAYSARRDYEVARGYYVFRPASYSGSYVDTSANLRKNDAKLDQMMQEEERRKSEAEQRKPGEFPPDPSDPARNRTEKAGPGASSTAQDAPAPPYKPSPTHSQTSSPKQQADGAELKRSQELTASVASERSLGYVSPHDAVSPPNSPVRHDSETHMQRPALESRNSTGKSAGAVRARK